MNWTYDAPADLLSVTLSDTPVVETVRVRPGVLVKFDARGRPVQLEVLGASEQFSKASLERLASPVELLTLAEAAAEVGLSPATLRKQIHNKRIRAQKRGVDWFISRAELWSYLEGRDSRGRSSAKGGMAARIRREAKIIPSTRKKSRRGRAA